MYKTNVENETKMVDSKPRVPKGMWVKCNTCKHLLYKKELVENLYICPFCSSYFRMPAEERISNILDNNSFKELYTNIEVGNPIDFPGYNDKILKIRSSTNLHEAIVVGSGKINDIDILIGACDTRFLMGSMGYIVGEKITNLFEFAIQKKLPVVLFNCSGGARMQEGIIALMQMAKTAAVIKKHSEAGLLYISILTDPTTGGVAASFAMLGDIIIAEPKALIGFAGPRVIEETIRQKLPEGFQRSEFLLEHGLIDDIIQRKDLRTYLGKIIMYHIPQKLKSIQDIKEKNILAKSNDLNTKDSWYKVLLSRKSNRPTALEFIQNIFEEFIEFHGDREMEEDHAIIGGIARLHEISITVVAHQKGHNVKERIKRNFGMPHPAGYKKALRLMKEAEKFKRPIITFIDTPGAACGIKAEEKGEAIAIAQILFEMSSLRVPILSILIGEGGSGGALGLAVANEVWALENATYSIISPEGFAAILWKDTKKAKEASAVMKMTTDELIKLGVIEKIIPEGEAIRENINSISTIIRNDIISFINKMSQKDVKEIIKMRYNRFRKL